MTIKTNFKLVCIDETQYWSDDIVKAAGGAIFCTYLFDALRPVHCCEITASYELYPLYSTPFSDDEEGSVSMMIMGHDSKDVVYMHCSGIDRMPESHIYDGGVEEHDEESWKDILAQQEEHYQGNVYLDIPAGFEPKLAAETPEPAML